MPNKDLTEQGRADIAAFVDELRRMPARADAGASRGRLIFALDATASREPTWDQACDVQAEMFIEAERLGGLDVQLVYYRGFGECRASRWVRRARRAGAADAGACAASPAGPRSAACCAMPATRPSKERVHALVFVGDAMEESVDELGHLAGELALRGVRAFLFHEGSDPAASQRLPADREAHRRRLLPVRCRLRRPSCASFCARSRPMPPAACARSRIWAGGMAGLVRLIAGQVG